jgi:GAF domain protein|nr:GAF domain-containing protein [uncultured Porphyromonas sp.]
MAEQLILEGKSREERYRELYPQLRALLSVETDRVANLANMAAALRQTFGFFWVGFYLVSERELVLGPFQGDIACTRIPYGRGVCGDAWAQGQTLVVPDVESYPGHIACSSLSRSEVVVPIYDRSGEIVGVLDIDSQVVGDFSEELDRPWLERYVGLLAPLFP